MTYFLLFLFLQVKKQDGELMDFLVFGQDGWPVELMRNISLPCVSTML